MREILAEEAPARVTTTSRVRNMTLAALLAALLAASAWVTIPLGPVPVTLQVFAVLLAALLLEPRWAASSVGVYLLLGAAGLPVFSGGVGGVGVLAGPRGGYLWGFLLGAFLASLLRTRLSRGRLHPVADLLASAACVAVIYSLGWSQLLLTTGLRPAAAFVAGVVPFVALDAAKAVVAAGVANALRRVAPVL